MKTITLLTTIIFTILLKGSTLAQSTSDRESDSLGKIIRDQYKGLKGLPPNVAKAGEKEIKVKDGKIHFGSDVTGHNRDVDREKKYINPSKASMIDPRMAEYDKERAAKSAKKISQKTKNTISTSTPNQVPNVQKNKSKSEMKMDEIRKKLKTKQ
ncbi:hypothetical protein [Sediminibacterium sp.]|uniref:hypothetical protein n=1 Tax=Sediminibacterium sp. TaxID=1917865 RepID=UPI003F6EC317